MKAVSNSHKQSVSESIGGATSMMVWKYLNGSPPELKSLPPTNGHSPIGAGAFFKGKTHTTHTLLPLEQTALIILTHQQKFLFILFNSVLIFGLIFHTSLTLKILVAGLSLFYFVDVIYNLWLILSSLKKSPIITFRPSQLAKVKDKELPTYTILSPMYKETNVLPSFLSAMDKLDWPKDKLEVLLLIEEDDVKVQEWISQHALKPYVRQIIVPNSSPRTKPKACNYGLSIANGEYLVIYDAEDIPEPQQLKKAFIAFQKVPKHVKCLQAKLNYHNPQQNWLTRFFTAEYSLWFDVILPGLQKLKTIIPLGGTSNHFRVNDLRQLQGWDPFNVTEDADLGVRIFRHGYVTAMIDSTTYEEANSDLVNWIRQRSRWIKGYMMTYLVHMRHPLEMFKNYGIHAWLMQITLGGRILFLFINPLMWILTISYFLFKVSIGPSIEVYYPAPIFYLAITSLVLGNFMHLYFYLIGCARSGHWSVMYQVVLMPLYWVLQSVSAVLALYQLMVKPHFWEKTNHGLAEGLETDYKSSMSARYSAAT